MKDITKLSIWPKLQSLGFEKVRFHAHGRVVHIGARLGTTKGEICIEPHDYTTRPYHITGPITNPYYAQCKLTEFGRTRTVTLLYDRINQHYDARQILDTVIEMIGPIVV